MAKCRACGKFLSSPLAASCVHCSAIYHKACIAVPGWTCPECKSKLSKSNNAASPVKVSSDPSSVNYGDDMTACSATPVGDTGAMLKPTTHNMLTVSHIPAETEKYPTQLSNVSLGLEIRLFREEMRKVGEELKEFRQEIAGLRSMITNCNNRMDQFENRLIALEARSEDESNAKVGFLEQTIIQLKQELHDRDQDLLQADIEIANLPENKGENPIHTVTVLAAKLGLTVTQEDIVFAERVGKLNENSDGNLEKKSRRLVVRLARRHLRDELLKSARVRRNVTSADLCSDSPAKRFYLNERLTPANRRLFYLVRGSAQHLQWKYTWTKRGRIYARQGDGKRAHWIRSEEDRLRVFGNVDVSET